MISKIIQTLQAAPTKKPRTTKAKAAQTVAKSADKPVKKTTKKSAAPKAGITYNFTEPFWVSLTT